MTTTRLIRNRLAVAAALLLGPVSAWAYIDPGAGMLLWQGLIAAIGAVLVFVRKPAQTVRYWIRRFLRR